jgi:hypothetical protein
LFGNSVPSLFAPVQLTGNAQFGGSLFGGGGMSTFASQPPPPVLMEKPNLFGSPARANK